MGKRTILVIDGFTPTELFMVGGYTSPELSTLARKLREITKESGVEVILPRHPDVPTTVKITPPVADRLRREVTKLTRRGNVHDSDDGSE